MAPTRTKRTLFGVLYALIVFCGLEVCSLLAIRLTRSLLVEPIRTTRVIYADQTDRLRRLLSSDSSGLLALDPLLGWRYRAGYRDSLNTMNSQGLRSAREYSQRVVPGVLRVAAFGDSFVYGNEVGDSAAWPAEVERLFPRIEVLNYGVGGYGVDQAYLRFCAEGTALSPRVVLISFMTDDLRRVVNVYRRFISTEDLPLVKPRFELDGRGDLALLPNALPRPADYTRYLRDPEAVNELGAHDAWYHPAIYRDPLYDYSATVRLFTNLWLRSANRYFAADRLFRHGEMSPSSTAFRIQIALFQRFAAAVRASGARPIVVFCPDRESLARVRRGKRTLFARLVEEVDGRGLEFVDLTRAFVEHGFPPDVRDWFMPGGHYSPLGNRVVAQWLGRELLRRTAAGGGAPPPLDTSLTLAETCPAASHVSHAAPTRPRDGGRR